MSHNPSDSEVPSTASTISTLLTSTARPSFAKLPTAGPSPMPPGATPSTVTTISSAFTKSATSVPPKAASFDHIFEEPVQPAKVQANLTGSKSIPSISSKKSKVIKRPPPIRTLEHHHHHHPISVDSKTDFKTKKVDENKVNYLPYHPPVAVDQTGLIQSIGKPFNPNNAKYLPDPGDEFMITRRASEVRLKHVKLYGDVNSTIVDGLVATLKLFSVLIGISGFLFFVYVLGVSVLWTPMEFVRYFLDAHPFYKVVYIVGVVQPMAVAPYCRYALLNLKFIRTYFLRVPLSLIFPTGVVLVSLIMFVEIVKTSGELKDFMESRMAHYYRVDHYNSIFAQEAWDGIQKTFDCCGYESSDEWLAYNKSHFPQSCCATSDCIVGSSDLKTSTCSGSYKAINVILAIAFASFGGAIGVFEIISVIFMRSLYACIGKELYDERNTLTIMFGRICSLCEIEDTDVELEYDYKHKEVNSSTSDSDEDHHKRHNSKDSKAPSATVSKGAIDDDSPSNTARPSTATLGRSRPTNASTLGVRKVGPAPAGRGRGRGRGKPMTDDIK